MFRADKENRKEKLVGLKLVPKEKDTWTSKDPLVKCLVTTQLLFPHIICSIMHFQPSSSYFREDMGHE